MSHAATTVPFRPLFQIVRTVLWMLLVTAAIALIRPHPTLAVSLQEYRQAVVDALAILDGATAGDEAAQTAALNEASQVLTRAEAVETPGGRQVGTTNPALRASLADQNFRAAHADLTALLDALDGAIAAGAPLPDASRQLAAILAHPEFRPPEPGLVERLLGPMVEPLRLAWERFWRSLAARLSGTGTDGSGLVWLMLGGLIVAGLVALMVGAFSGSVVSAARPADSRRLARAGPRASRARALELAASGDYRAAVHELHLATLLTLNERGLLRFRPHLTNREHLAGDQVREDLRPVLVPAIDVYDRLWYSGRAVGAEDWHRFRTLAEAVEAAAKPRGSAAARASASGEAADL